MGGGGNLLSFFASDLVNVTTFGEGRGEEVQTNDTYFAKQWKVGEFFVYVACILGLGCVQSNERLFHNFKKQ